MEQVSATRSALLAHRGKILLATQGRDLLKDRRTALITEFSRLGASVLQSMDLIDRDAGIASRTLGLAIAVEGLEPIASAGFAAAAGIGVRVRTRSVAGVAVVEVDRTTVLRARTSRGFSLIGSSARIDAVARSFEVVIERLLELAALELSVRRLAEEIARTTRRMNALEHIIVPRLIAERAKIALILEERELEDRIRLRRMRASDRRAGTLR
ncbi:V-type ATP synthase subunit D [Microlunatus sp. Gsoil 973]|uniref:V-type ATP synthase subunit D n=1 Tax=Microlunatus sp. Gsoil 973 TaxID=2672569 RepID=UPI0018A86FC5|nr:V-type ATP synthase subunit D [Microlunatus sp. Gsoil 973]